MISYILIICILSLVSAQVLKYMINIVFKRDTSIDTIISTGGLPSSHSALVTALTTSIALTTGVSTIEFAISAVLSLIVLHDAMGVRYEAGKHAIMLNKLQKQIDGESYDEVKAFKEMLGHKPIEVLAGILLGLSIAFGAYLLGFAY